MTACSLSLEVHHPVRKGKEMHYSRRIHKNLIKQDVASTMNAVAPTDSNTLTSSTTMITNNFVHPLITKIKISSCIPTYWESRKTT